MQIIQGESYLRTINYTLLLFQLNKQQQNNTIQILRITSLFISSQTYVKVVQNGSKKIGLFLKHQYINLWHISL